MLVRLHSGPSLPGAGFADPFEMLEACHGRIRSFTAVAQRLASQEAPPSQVAEAASGVHLYFGTALPLHEQDEEETLWTALRGSAPPARLETLFDRLVQEHRTIEQVLRELLPQWADLANRPQGLAERRRSLSDLTQELGRAFEPHLAMEEQELYPLAREVLPAASLRPMLLEMRTRRQPVFAKLQKLHPHE